jgi:hypothetical protein
MSSARCMNAARVGVAGCTISGSLSLAARAGSAAASRPRLPNLTIARRRAPLTAQ